MLSSKKHSQRKKISKKKSARTIALLTDFGLQDQYVAAMKGVIISINPSVQIVDITHEVKPHNTQQAGYLLWSAYKFFPNGTIFICVVDPGVGSSRPFVCVKTRKFIFLAPDNGLLNFILNEENVLEEIKVQEKNLKKHLPYEVSATFHGRDVLAPIAGYLSKGLLLKRLGAVITPQIGMPMFVNSRTDTIHPRVLHIDHFGNIITNIKVKNTEQAVREMKAISVGSNLVSRWINYYDEAPVNTPCLIKGSGELIEISVKNNNAAHLLETTFDTPVKIYWQ